jgi:hypothetical protein
MLLRGLRGVTSSLYGVTMKVCSKCKEGKSESEFHKNRSKKDGLQSRCKTCDKGDSKRRKKRWIENNRPRSREHDRSSYYRRKELIDNLKDVPCAECDNKYPPHVMDFDHVRGEKLFNVATNKRRELETTLEEISKCEVVCANCHRIRTHERLTGTGDGDEPKYPIHHR